MALSFIYNLIVDRQSVLFVTDLCVENLVVVEERYG